MEIEVKEPKKCERVLEITLPPAQVQEKIDKLYQKYQSTLHIDGFRKGKVPIHLIKGKFGESIKEEAVNRMLEDINRAYGQKIIKKGAKK